MTNLNDFNYVDDDDDVLAAHPNELQAGSFVSKFKNVEVLSGTRTLLDIDTPIQNYDCNGVNRKVLAPEADTVNNHPYWIVNASNGGETITFRDHADTTDLAVVGEGAAALFIPDGAGNYIAVGSGGGSSSGGTSPLLAHYLSL